MHTVFDHPLFQAAAVFILTLLGKWIYDKFLSKSSRVTREVFDANNTAVGIKIEAVTVAVNLKLDALSTSIDLKIDAVTTACNSAVTRMAAACASNQKECSSSVLNKMALSIAVLDKQIANYTLRLDDGDDTFKSTRHIQRAVLITLLRLCEKLQIECDPIVKTFVDRDIME